MFEAIVKSVRASLCLVKACNIRRPSLFQLMPFCSREVQHHCTISCLRYFLRLLILTSAGLGVPAQHLSEEEFARLDPSTRIEDSSTAFLRQQLIGKKAKALSKATPLRSAISLPGLEPGFQPARVKQGASASDVNSNSTGTQQNPILPNAELSDEEEIGRSGLGSTRKSNKRKRKQSTASPEDEIESADTPKAEVIVPVDLETSKPQSDDENEAMEGAEPIADTSKPKPRTKKMSSRSKPVARSYLDEILAKKEAKKAGKKSKNKAG